MFDEKQSVMSKKSTKIVAAIIVLILVGGGVALALMSGGDKKEKKTATSSTTTTTKKKETIAPLTGLVDETGLSLTRPALAIKIGNTIEARPQAGISQADIVYEEIVEGGVTRYMAVFNSQVPPRVGPVRSVRNMDPDVALNWGGIFAFSGGTPPNSDKIKGTKGILAIDETAAGDAMKRDSKRPVPHNLYVQTATMFVKGGTPIPPKPVFTYSSKVPKLGQAALKFDINFIQGFACTWQYDEASGKYLRFYGTKPVVDEDGTQVAVANVVVQTVAYPSEKEGGKTTGSGKVQIFRDGKMLTGTWKRPDTTAPAEFIGDDGTKIALKPGQSWVELASESTPVALK